MTQPIKIDLVRIDGGTQPRVAISEQTVSEYAEAMASADANMPAVDLFFDGVVYWLADGFHRYHAARKNGLDHVVATVHQGTRRDAVLFSVGANQSHGLRRTNDDKRRAITTLLQDEEWSKWSDREIGRRCGVTPDMVGDKRRSLSTVDSEKGRIYTTKHGTEATMKTENIGRAKSVTMPDRSKEAVRGRRERVREMAEQGYSSRQISAELGISSETTAKLAREQGVTVHADKAIGKSRLHDSNRILEVMVMDAEHLTADVGLIDFNELDATRLPAWLSSLKASRDSLGAFIRALMKEQQKNGEAA